MTDDSDESPVRDIARDLNSVCGPTETLLAALNRLISYALGNARTARSDDMLQHWQATTEWLQSVRTAVLESTLKYVAVYDEVFPALLAVADDQSEEARREMRARAAGAARRATQRMYESHLPALVDKPAVELPKMSHAHNRCAQ